MVIYLLYALCIALITEAVLIAFIDKDLFEFIINASDLSKAYKRLYSVIM
ncbi:hypothetical protein L370_00720 [Enterobacter sp. MGH 24]|nr:hypothetical protein L370_00720 [Enterobacter sp. MGH 24]